jgi:hypothetical protein
MPRSTDSSDPVFARLTEVRHALLRLHKVLLDAERVRYEKTHGPVANAGAFLQLVINEPSFNWLHRLSELVVQIDEAMEDDEAPLTPDAGKAFLAQAKALLTPSETGEGFARRYFEALQSNPEVGVMQGELRKLLAA